MKRNGRSASAFPQPLQRHETDDIKEEPTMIVHPEPSAIIPDRRIYERRESGVRSYARSMPRQFVRDRKSVVKGKSVSVRVDLGGCRIIKKNNRYRVDVKHVKDNTRIKYANCIHK